MSGAQKPPPHKPMCRNCKHFEIERVLSRDGRVMSDRTARCQFPLNTILLPASVPTRHSLHAVRMGPNDGALCLTFEQRETT